jgi:hypothetical protein
MTVIVYRSTDASAPVLTGAVGSLIGLLDAVLVNGYGAKSPLGWTKAFTGTNLASYKQPVSTTNSFYLDVDNSTAGASGSWYAKVRGYETMTAVGTGTNPFPTVAQLATMYWEHSQETLSATSVQWMVVGTNKMFYLWIKMISTDINAPNGDFGDMYCFGDMTSFRAGDAYNTMIMGKINRQTVTTQSSFAIDVTTNVGAATSGHYITRSFTQNGASVTCGKTTDNAKGNAQLGIGFGNSTALLYPNNPDGGLYMAPIWIHEDSTRALRGVLPGLWAPLHNKPLVTHDTFPGTGNLAGKSFEALTTKSWVTTLSATAVGQLFLETSNTW